MDFTKMLVELKAEHEAVTQAILVFERIASGRGKRRVRPPAWVKTMKRRGRPPGSKMHITTSAGSPVRGEYLHSNTT